MTTLELQLEQTRAELRRLSSAVEQLVATTPQRTKTWLEPREIAPMLGISVRTLAVWRTNGRFRRSQCASKAPGISSTPTGRWLMPRRCPVDGDVPATAGQSQHRARRGLRKRSSVGSVASPLLPPGRGPSRDRRLLPGAGCVLRPAGCRSAYGLTKIRPGRREAGPFTKPS